MSDALTGGGPEAGFSLAPSPVCGDSGCKSGRTVVFRPEGLCPKGGTPAVPKIQCCGAGEVLGQVFAALGTS